MNALELWFAHQAAVFMLEATRLSGLLIAGPLAWTFAPVKIRAGLVLMMTYLIHSPTRAADMQTLDPLAFLLCTGSEFGLGVSIGLVARLIIGVGEVAADAIAPIMGLGAAQMFDPTLGGSGTILTRLLRYMGTWIALAVGLHHMLLGAVFHSFGTIPPGTIVDVGALVPHLLRLTSEVLISGVKLALPLMAVLFVAQVGLAFIARAAPAMQIFSVGFAVTLGVGFLLWIVFAPDVVQQLVQLRSWAEAAMLQTLRILEGR